MHTDYAINPITNEPALQHFRDAALLVADDDLADIIKSQLEYAGIKRVDTATNGQQAVDKITGSTFDLIILNYRMPYLKGTEILRRMRGAGDTTPVIMISAWEQDQIPDLTDDLLIEDFIDKPYHGGFLVSRVALILTKHAKFSSPAPADNPPS